MWFQRTGDTHFVCPRFTGCLTCFIHCSEKAALSMAFWKRPVPAGVAIVMIVVVLFGGGVLTGMLTDHWQTSLSYDDYRQLIPMASRLGHYEQEVKTVYRGIKMVFFFSTTSP